MAEPGAGDDKTKARINLSNAKVLVIQPARSDILSRILSGFGVRSPVSCDTPEQAWEAMQTTDFDLAVCDGDMAEGQVLDFIRSLRQIGPEPNRYCSVVLLQGHTPTALIEKARDCGANIVVVKPVRPDVILDRIIWVATSKRSFLETDHYVGPDRRFQNLGPPMGSTGRRKTDSEDLTVGEAESANLSQDDLDNLVKPTKFKL